MDMLILRTNIKSDEEFRRVFNNLSNRFAINDCTIDLEDRDKVLRLIGNNLNLNDITEKVEKLGFACEDLPD